jgi:WD40 repeat protein
MPLSKLTFVLTVLVSFSTRAEAPITAAALSPDGTQVVLGSQSGIEIRSWPELALSKKLTTQLTNIHDVQFSPDGRTLLAAGGSPAENGAVEILSWPAGQQRQRVVEHTDVVYRVAWSPDGKRWATAGADGVCQVYAADSGARLTRSQEHSRAVLSLVFLDDETLASVAADQTVRLWEAGTGRHVRTLDNHTAAVNDICVRPGSSDPARRVVATIGEDRTVRLWQPAIGRLMRFARLSSMPRAVIWSATGDRLFVGCNDGRVRIVDADTMEIVGEFDGLNGRIHELVMDTERGRILVCGEKGCGCVKPEP